MKYVLIPKKLCLESQEFDIHEVHDLGMSANPSGTLKLELVEENPHDPPEMTRMVIEATVTVGDVWRTVPGDEYGAIITEMLKARNA